MESTLFPKSLHTQVLPFGGNYGIPYTKIFVKKILKRSPKNPIAYLRWA